MKDYKEGNYKNVIIGLEVLDNSNLATDNSDRRRALSDAFYYWRAKSFLELKDYNNALRETFRFRATNNHITSSYVFDQFWPKQFYLQGLAYEGLGDERNAIESYREFLNIWSEADEDLPEIIDAKNRLNTLRFNS